MYINKVWVCSSNEWRDPPQWQGWYWSRVLGNDKMISYPWRTWWLIVVWWMRVGTLASKWRSSVSVVWTDEICYISICRMWFHDQDLLLWIALKGWRLHVRLCALVLHIPLFWLVRGDGGGLETHGAVAWCIWVKNPYVEECILASIPKASHSDVKSCAVFSIGCVMVENFTWK